MADIVFILNSAAGTKGAVQTQQCINDMAAEAGIPIKIELVEHGADVAALVGRAVAEGARKVVAGGGDGTINAVAGALVDSDVVLGVLPLGTLNHFAKDLGIPLQIAEAMRVILYGDARSIDIGEVNGCIFLNNSSLGVYPKIVRYREAEQHKGRSKWLAFGSAVLSAMRRHAIFRVELQIDRGQLLARRTAFVFIGNNEYEMTGLRIGARQDLSDGNLWLCLPRRGGRLDLLRLVLRALVGQLRDSDMDSIKVKTAVIKTRKRQISVATDGEVHLMRGPLSYRIRPLALKVAVPGAGSAPQATD